LNYYKSYWKTLRHIHRLPNWVRMRERSLEWNHRRKLVRAISSTSPFQNRRLRKLYSHDSQCAVVWATTREASVLLLNPSRINEVHWVHHVAPREVTGKSHIPLTCKLTLVPCSHKVPKLLKNSTLFTIVLSKISLFCGLWMMLSHLLY